MALKASWLYRGYFDFSAEDDRATTSQRIRDGLVEELGRPFRIKHYPVGPAWRHTIWWRESDADYSEAQFFAQIRDYPVLSVGVSIEKGREDADAPSAKRMDRLSWDWPRLVASSSVILESDVPECATKVGHPITFRTRLLPPGPPPDVLADQAFTYTDGRWYQRGQGTASCDKICEYIQQIDQERSRWANLRFAVDLPPAEIDNADQRDIVRILVAFNGLRKRLRGT